MKKLMMLTILLIICFLTLFGCEGNDFKKSKLTTSTVVYYKGDIIEITNEARLHLLLQQYANIGTHRILNQSISLDSIQDIGKKGLVIDFKPSGDKPLTVTGYNEDVMVKRILAVDDDKSLLVVFVEDSQTVVALTESEMSELRDCFKLKS